MKGDAQKVKLRRNVLRDRIKGNLSEAKKGLRNAVVWQQTRQCDLCERRADNISPSTVIVSSTRSGDTRIEFASFCDCSDLRVSWQIEANIASPDLRKSNGELDLQILFAQARAVKTFRFRQSVEQSQPKRDASKAVKKVLEKFRPQQSALAVAAVAAPDGTKKAMSSLASDAERLMQSAAQVARATGVSVKEAAEGLTAALSAGVSIGSDLNGLAAALEEGQRQMAMPRPIEPSGELALAQAALAENPNFRPCDRCGTLGDLQVERDFMRRAINVTCRCACGLIEHEFTMTEEFLRSAGDSIAEALRFVEPLRIRQVTPVERVWSPGRFAFEAPVQMRTEDSSIEDRLRMRVRTSTAVPPDTLLVNTEVDSVAVVNVSADTPDTKKPIIERAQKKRKVDF